MLHPRKGLGHVAVVELKQLASLSVPWRGAMLNSNAWQLASCDRSGSGVTVPYRHGLHRCIGDRFACPGQEAEPSVM